MNRFQRMEEKAMWSRNERADRLDEKHIKHDLKPKQNYFFEK